MSYHQFSSSGGSGVGQNKNLINFDANIIFVDATLGLGSEKIVQKRMFLGQMCQPNNLELSERG